MMYLDYPVPILLLPVAVLAAVALAVPRTCEFLTRSRATLISIAVLFITGTVLLNSANHLLGDGLTHLGNTERIWAPTEPLDLFLLHLVYRITGSMLASYRIIATVTGAFYLLAIYLTTRLVSDHLHRAIIVLAFLSTATIQFYFGYVESYTLLHVFTMYFIYAAWRDHKSKSSTYLPLLFFLLAVASHFSAMSLLPAVIYLYRRRMSPGLKYVLALLVVVAAVVAFAVGIEKVFVPPVATDFSGYSLFSRQHLLDLVNILLLSCPAFFLAIPSRRSGHLVRFAAIALAGCLVFFILVDPKIGAFRDWDLLSIFALPLCTLVALRAPRQRMTLVALAVVIILRVIPWLDFNSEQQLAFVKSKVASDIHYSCEYDQGWRLISWGILLQNLDDPEGAIDAFQERLKCKPADARTLGLLAPTQFNLRRYSAAYATYRRALQAEPNNLNFYYKSMYLAFRTNDIAAAESLWQRSPAKLRSSPEAQRLHAGILALKGYHQEALARLQRFPAEDGEAYLPYVLAQSCAAAGDSRRACTLVSRAVELDPGDKKYIALRDSLCSM
jgi:tetratricopeptide (TPR) repeat protein